MLWYDLIDIKLMNAERMDYVLSSNIDWTRIFELILSNLTCIVFFNQNFAQRVSYLQNFLVTFLHPKFVHNLIILHQNLFVAQQIFVLSNLIPGKANYCVRELRCFLSKFIAYAFGILINSHSNHCHL